jgi:hypothetical protein
MGLPGLALFLLLDRRLSLLEVLTASLCLSPVITCGIAVLLLLGGAAPDMAAKWVILGAGLAFLAGIARRWLGPVGPDGETTGLTGRQWAALGVCVLITLVLVGYLPLSREWWRFRADAWFHWAVVAEIADSGLPPEDPYFAGYTLQYMWFYHVLVLVLARAAALDPFWVMTLINLQAVCGLFAATMLLAGVFARDFQRRLWSCLTVVFGLNGLIWLFLPLKIIRAFIGDVRSMDEIARQYSLSPLRIQQAQHFLIVFRNQDFLLDKFIVATAVGTAFSLMAVFWYASSEYLRSRRPSLLVAFALAMIGLIGFHTLFGMVMTVALFGGLGLMMLLRRRIDGYSIRPSLELAGVCAAAIVVTIPYLYAITHLKESEHVFPLDFSIPKVVGIIITCAAVILLASFQRAFFRNREMPQRFFQFGILTVAVFCSVIILPASNTFDKLPLFPFYPLAVIGGWSIADVISRRKSFAAKTGTALAMVVLFFGVPNAVSFAAYYATPSKPMYTGDEIGLAAWVRENTTREAVFIDRNDELFLLVAGPRRLYCGRWAYAQQWGYNKVEMSERLHTRDAVVTDRPLDLTALRLLGEAPWELYAVDRRDNATAPSTLSSHPELFEKVFTGTGIDLYRVDTAACSRAADELRRAGKREMTEEELLRESGL